jgi:hypothetical protein
MHLVDFIDEFGPLGRYHNDYLTDRYWKDSDVSAGLVVTTRATPSIVWVKRVLSRVNLKAQSRE